MFGCVELNSVIMDVIASVKFYLNKMVEECGVGLKVLLMDKETVRFV